MEKDYRRISALQGQQHVCQSPTVSWSGRWGPVRPGGLRLRRSRTRYKVWDRRLGAQVHFATAAGHRRERPCKSREAEHYTGERDMCFCTVSPPDETPVQLSHASPPIKPRKPARPGVLHCRSPTLHTDWINGLATAVGTTKRRT